MIPTLLEAALRALLLALLVGSGLALFRVRNVMAQKLAWAMVLAAACAMPLAVRWSLGPRVALPALPRLLAAPQQARAAAPPVQDPAPALRAALAAPPLPAQPARRPRRQTPPAVAAPAATQPLAAALAAPPPPAPRPAAPLPPALLGWIAYAAVLAVILLRLLLGLARALRLWRGALPVDPAQLPADLRSSAAALRSSAQVRTPVTVAAGVLLPAGFPAWTEEKLRIVLAHELSHLRQRDFYLQLLAGLHAAAFWFSPLGWWLKRKLSDLSETISDRAGLSAAADGPSYAQVLLEFAALPRPTFQGVPMARTSNLAGRIERLLNDSSFRQAFAGGRLRALAAGLLVPLALVAATAAFRAQAATQDPTAPPAPAVAAAPASPAPPAAPAIAAQEPAAAPAPPAPVVVEPQAPPAPPSPDVLEREVEVSVTGGDDQKAAAKLEAEAALFNRHIAFASSKDGQAWALISGKDATVVFSGAHAAENNEALAKARKSEGDRPFFWFQRDGKSYIVDDPATVAEIQAAGPGFPHGLFVDPGPIEVPMHIEIPKIETVSKEDLKKQMEAVDTAMDKLRARLGKQSMQELNDLQAKLGDLQAKLGQMQGTMLVQMNGLNDEKMKLIQKDVQVQVRTHMRQVREAHDAQVQSIIDRSLQDGKARPVQ